jgi:hypothetical protein
MMMRPMQMQILGIATAISLCGCASQGAASPVDSRQAAFVKTTCQSVMRVRTNAELFGCMSSLSDSLAVTTQSASAWRSEKDCADQGLTRNTPEFSICVLHAQNGYSTATGQATGNADAPSGGPANVAYGAIENELTSPGYGSDRFDARRRREEYSCAELGLDPNFGQFTECVDGLDDAMQAADNPLSG